MSLFSGCPPGVALAPHTDPLRSGVLSPASFIAWVCARLLFLYTLADTCRLRCFLSVLLTFRHIPLEAIAE